MPWTAALGPLRTMPHDHACLLSIVLIEDLFKVPPVFFDSFHRVGLGVLMRFLVD